ncbi:uncharacterized protein LOC123699850 isoform X1 [Colias croceus]|uniref:uncharacterized protein LOC123699850 isoform X1 n=1 Tax=Colias crocea TaxID=72248 RepID=UPI001E27A331|nr:uncharacterized protein LOC123699850 isoform X1 [Colias croceus]
MEQMYLIEIFIDKVTIYATLEDEQSGANKNLIIKIRFGPKVEFIIKEGQLALNDDKKDDVMECDENGRRKWSRTIRVGKSYLFPSYPDTVLMILSKFPLEIEIWNDDENEVEIFVGVGTMYWETEFFHMLKETAEASKLHEPLTIKQNTPLFGECYCKRVGEISFILRLSALGESIITEFQQLMTDPDAFVFRTNKAPSMFQCKRIEGDDKNFCMVGSLYETTTLEDPDVVDKAQQKIEICTELQSCGMGQKDAEYRCQHEGTEATAQKKTYPINKIRMGDITGPCGNTNCPLAHKVRTYIRNLESYKKEAEGKVDGTKVVNARKICGTCGCKDDRWHREECPEKLEKEGKQGKAVCSGCGGMAQVGETCEDRKNKMFGTGATPRGSKTQVSYVFSVTKVPGFKESVYGTDYTVQNLTTDYYLQMIGQTPAANRGGCCCSQNRQISNLNQARTVLSATEITPPENKASTRSLNNNAMVYNVELSSSKRKIPVFNCVEIAEDKDCKCNPPKPSPPCKTFDCECIQKSVNIAARKAHKPYCPQYKHKSNCPVNMMNEEEENKKADVDEDEAEPLPYGLPPIKLGPCPVMGRPCSVPDGFARMYKTAAIAPQPPSYSDAGKVCCSKEYERIKKAIKDYMKYEKEHDYRCINKFNVDTERRCCDKEQVLLSLMGKSCCGAHKLAIQEKDKEERKNA